MSGEEGLITEGKALNAYKGYLYLCFCLNIIVKEFY